MHPEKIIKWIGYTSLFFLMTLGCSDKSPTEPLVPKDLTADINQDGKTDILDAISMLFALRDGTCQNTNKLLASTWSYLDVGKIEGLSKTKIEYIEKIQDQLNLTDEETISFQIALYGFGKDRTQPKSFSLSQNFPNPFNPCTSISFSGPESFSDRVSIKIYNLRGCLVRNLIDEVREAGSYSVFWDGTDDSGRQVSSGVYIYRLQAGEFVQTRKMVLLK